ALQQDAPETVRVCWIVGGVRFVFLEWDRGIDFVRRRGEMSFDAQVAESAHDRAVKLRHRLRHERNYLESAIAADHTQFVRDEIEANFKYARAEWNRRSRQAARGDIKRDVPGMIRPRRERETDLADDLRPHVQRLRGFFPFLERKRRPNLFRCRHESLPIKEIDERTANALEHPARVPGRAAEHPLHVF